MNLPNIAENPQLSIEALTILERKVQANKATVEDYKKLESILASVGVNNFLLDHFKEEDVFSFQDFIDERNKTSEKKNSRVETILTAYVIGAIGAVKDYLRSR